MGQYVIEFEIDGPMAMFARPDTGASPISYPVPTPSALRGIVENIKRLKSAHFVPVKVQVCKPVRFVNYAHNYNGPLRKSDTISKNSAMQVRATALFDVCYKVFGIIADSGMNYGVNSRHALQDMFNRRLRNGRCFRRTYLGWSEFLSTYIGPLRDCTKPLNINMHVGAVLKGVFKPNLTKYVPEFLSDVSVNGGEVIYDKDLEIAYREVFTRC